MIRRTLALLMVITVAAGLTGCSLRSERGTLIGAGVGLVAGAILDHEEPAHRALVGATVGAIGGYAVTSEHDDYYGSGRHGSYGHGSYEHGSHRRGSHGGDDYAYRGHRGPHHDD